MNAFNLMIAAYVFFGLLLTGRSREGRWQLSILWRRLTNILLHKSTRLDIAVYLINKLLLALVVTSVAGGILFYFFEFHTKQPALSVLKMVKTIVTSESFYIPNAVFLNLAFTLAYSVAADGARALVHYCFHKIPVLWEFHKLHHSAEVLSPMSNFRAAIFEEFITGVMKGVGRGLMAVTFISLFGLSSFNIVTIVGFSLFAAPKTILGHLQHSHIWVNWTGKLAYIWAPPSCHLIHHSVEERHWDKNFGAIYTVWDLLLGTLYLTKTEEHFKIGVRNSKYRKYVNNDLRYYFVGVYADAYRKIVGKTLSYERVLENDSKSPIFECWCADPQCSARGTLDHLHVTGQANNVSDQKNEKPVAA